MTISAGGHHQAATECLSDKDGDKVDNCDIINGAQAPHKIVLHINLRTGSCSKARQTVPSLRDVDPGTGMDQNLIISRQRDPPTSRLKQVSDPPELI